MFISDHEHRYVRHFNVHHDDHRCKVVVDQDLALGMVADLGMVVGVGDMEEEVQAMEELVVVEVCDTVDDAVDEPVDDVGAKRMPCVILHINFFSINDSFCGNTYLANQHAQYQSECGQRYILQHPR